MLGLAMTACAPRKAGNVNSGSDELTMLVGTYTDGNSKGIYTFRFNQETGLATSLSSIEVLNPSYLIPSEDGRFVYVLGSRAPGAGRGKPPGDEAEDHGLLLLLQADQPH